MTSTKQLFEDIKLPASRRKFYADRPRWEVERINSMLDDITKKDVVYDIGAEVGDITVLLQKKTGATLVPIEASPKMWPHIKKVYDLNKLEPPILSVAALLGARNDNLEDKNTVLNVLTWPPQADEARTSDPGFTHLNEGDGYLPQITVGVVWMSTNVTPTVLNIDVEGAEYEVLEGAKSILQSTNMKVWVSVHPEFMFHRYGHYTADLCGMMERLGYTYEILAFDHEFHFYFTKS